MLIAFQRRRLSKIVWRVVLDMGVCPQEIPRGVQVFSVQGSAVLWMEHSDLIVGSGAQCRLA